MNLFFIAGYTGDIGNALMKQLQNKGEVVIGLSGRWEDRKIEEVIEENLQKYQGSIDKIIFINAIGCGVYGDFLSLSKEDFQKSFECNFLVPVHLIQIFSKIVLKYFPEKNVKKIIYNINSQAALKSFWNGGAYNSIKAALSMALKVFEKEYRNKGFKVKQIYPPVIKTKMLEKMPYLPDEKKVVNLDDFVKNVVKDLSED